MAIPQKFYEILSRIAFFIMLQDNKQVLRRVMGYHTIFAGIVVVTAFAAFINDRYLKLPKTIALTIISISLSIVVTQLIKLTPNLIAPIHTLLSSVDFKTAVLDVMLGYLLFASALHINVISLKKNLTAIIYLASVGVITSTIFTGFIFWEISKFLHFPLTLADCLIFGALISPTDPIAVTAVFQTTKTVPEQTKSRITGEALFNDAVSILLLIVLVRIFYLHQGHDITIEAFGFIILKEALGGIIWGWLTGYVTAIFLSRTNDSEVSILLTIATASAGYVIAQHLHLSAAMTMVIAGLVVGNYSRNQKLSHQATLTLNNFWEIIDGLLNAFLFVLIGLEMLTMNLNLATLIMGVIGIAVIFVARFGSMLLPSTIASIIKRKNSFNWPEITMLCWGGIRGGISIALALAIADIPQSVVAITYFLVIFSILFQGSSFKWIVNKLYPR